MSAPLVSVIIPTYNRSLKVIRAIESVLAQDYEPLEVLVIDDGSTDDTEEVIAAKYGNTPRVRYFKKKNGGVAAARNLGLREAKGELLALLDADDTFHPSKIRLQAEVLNRFPDAGLVWSDMAAVGTDGRLLHERYLRRMYGAYDFYPTPRHLFKGGLEEIQVEGIPAFQGYIFSAMVLGNLIHNSCVVLRRSRLEEVGPVDESLGNCGEDIDFHLRICRAGNVAYLDTVLVDYEIGASDALTSPEKMIGYALYNLKLLEETLRKDAHLISLPRSLIKKQWSRVLDWVGKEHLAGNKNAKAVVFFWKSFLKDPTNPSRLLYLAMALLPAPVLKKLKLIVKQLKEMTRELQKAA